MDDEECDPQQERHAGMSVFYGFTVSAFRRLEASWLTHSSSSSRSARSLRSMLFRTYLTGVSLSGDVDVDTEMKDNARALSARAFSVGMALTCASWVVLGLSQSPAADRWTPVRLGLALLHATVAILFALRIPAKAEGSVADLIAALPSLILSGVLFRLSPPPSTWPWWLSGLFAGGAVFAAGSLAVLGRSFAFMPARRDLVTTGPYRLVRRRPTSASSP